MGEGSGAKTPQWREGVYELHTPLPGDLFAAFAAAVA
jgi:hypothetical protein